MCGRYTNTRDPEELNERLRIPIPAEGTRRYNIAPTEEVLCIRAAQGAGEAVLLRWDLVPSFWSKPLREKPPMFNARMEDVRERPAYRRLIGRAQRRCLLIADGYYEWVAPERRGLPRQPYFFQVDGGGVFAFAGLWTPAKVDGEWLHSCTMLTCDPSNNHLASDIHARMPVILADPDAQQAWLDESLDADAALSLCGALPEARMRVQPANPAMNRAGVKEGPWLLEAPAHRQS